MVHETDYTGLDKQVGDYPYLDRPNVEKILVRDSDLWEAMREEGRGRWDVDNLDDYPYDD